MNEKDAEEEQQENDNQGGMILNPIIGVTNPGRQGIMNQVSLYLPGVSPKDHFYTGETTRPWSSSISSLALHSINAL